MNYWTDNTKFNKYVEALGSTFAAIKYVSQIARKRCKSVHNCITESQAIAWVITGVEPKDVKLYYRNLKLHKQRARLYKEERLMYIEDTDVKDAVSFSIDQSRKVNHLIYFYKNVTDDCRMARVRILCNIIWDELQQLEMNEKI